MSEDDRAAKAARAKALLSKRRQKKTAAGGGVEPSGSASPISPSRTTTPAPPEHPEENKRDISDIFKNDDSSDNNWLESLPRAPSTSQPEPTQAQQPPNSVQPPPHDEEELKRLKTDNGNLQSEIKRLEGLLHDANETVRKVEGQVEQERQQAQKVTAEMDEARSTSEKLLQNEKQTISLLVSEKASLSRELERLKGMDEEYQDAVSSLNEERSKSQKLEQSLSRLQGESHDNMRRIQELQNKEKELIEKCSHQERQQTLSSASIRDLQKEVEQHQRRARELEERIQNDDRVERLEASLRNAQEHADELEFQLSKLKQTHSNLKLERDELESTVKQRQEDISEWETKHTNLSEQHQSMEQQLLQVTKERDDLQDSHKELQTVAGSNTQSISALREKLNQVNDELAGVTKQLLATQTELKLANSRASEAERIQKELQSEGATLLHSVDEMRPKIVELTALKLELGEKIESLQRAVQSRDATIARLETTLEEIRDKHDAAETEWKEKYRNAERKWQDQFSQQSKDQSLAQLTSTELQTALAELQEEVNSSQANIRTLEADRSNYHHEAVQHMEEIDRLTAISTTQQAELAALRLELEDRRAGQDEESDILARAQNDIESLRAELRDKDDELERLHAIVSTPVQDRSLDEEMLTSLNQQHKLEISTLQSKIRSLESAVFEAEAKNHSLLKQLTFSNGNPPNGQSDIKHGADPLKAQSHKLAPGHAPSRPRNFDQNLTPEMQRKRQVSLRMLKARIDSESAAAYASEPPSRAITPDVHGRARIKQRPQILDESHIFWCHSCRGDLVVL